MVKLLIIADDFTGALDTGVQFAASGAATRVVVGQDCDFSSVDESIEVLVQDVETRHLSAKDAYKVLLDVSIQATQAGISYLYKKTDSALRGNIGSELAGLLAGTGGARVHFVPAFPRQGRTTVNGIHYIDGVPVAQSVFGDDPFEPVLTSDVTKIIAGQVELPTHIISDKLGTSHGQQGILIYDAANDSDLCRIAQTLCEQEDLHLLAGCAGFAATLPALLNLQSKVPTVPSFDEGFLVACGSVNPITVKQLETAAKEGFAHISLTPQQKLEPLWLESSIGEQTVHEWLSACQGCENIIFDTNDPKLAHADTATRTEQYVAEWDIPLEQVRIGISGMMGSLVKRLLDGGVKKTLMLTGGDTLLAFMQKIGICQLDPLYEIAPGTVLSQLCYNGHSYNLISKSGGFGNEHLLSELIQRIKSDKGLERTTYADAV